MTEQNTTDKQLNDYLSGKSPLSGLYQQLTADEPSAKTDAVILAEARHEKKSKPRGLHWRIPAAIAAMLIVGISLLWWQQKQTPSPTDYKESAAPTRPGSLPQHIDRNLHDNPAADQWLERILTLHTAGKTAQAAAEFKKFRDVYPAYTLDTRRFGDLRQYDQ